MGANGSRDVGAEGDADLSAGRAEVQASVGGSPQPCSPAADGRVSTPCAESAASSHHDEFSDLNLNLAPHAPGVLQSISANVARVPTNDPAKSPHAAPVADSDSSGAVDDPDLAEFAELAELSQSAGGLGVKLARAVVAGNLEPEPQLRVAAPPLCATTDEDEALMRQILMGYDQLETPSTLPAMAGTGFSAVSVPDSVASSVEPIQSLQSMRKQAAKDVPAGLIILFATVVVESYPYEVTV